jgi:protein kinase A
MSQFLEKLRQTKLFGSSPNSPKSPSADTMIISSPCSPSYAHLPTTSGVQGGTPSPHPATPPPSYQQHYNNVQYQIHQQQQHQQQQQQQAMNGSSFIHSSSSVQMQAQNGYQHQVASQKRPDNNNIFVSSSTLNSPSKTSLHHHSSDPNLKSNFPLYTNNYLQQNNTLAVPHGGLKAPTPLPQYHGAPPNIPPRSQPKYKLNDFHINRTLGTGSFGRVHLVRAKESGKFFAMKVLKKTGKVHI